MDQNNAQILTNLYAIVAMSENRVIGVNNQLPWHLPADLKYFKSLTMNQTIVMGRKTYDAIGKPLPHRHNIVLTRDQHLQIPGCEIVRDANEILDYAHRITTPVFVIGGEVIFKHFLPYLSRIYLTLVHTELAGDAFFPALNDDEWHEVERVTHEKDDKHAYAFSFITLERRRN